MTKTDGNAGKGTTSRNARRAPTFSARSRALAAALAALGAPLGVAQEATSQCQYEVTAIIQAPPCPITGPPPTNVIGLSNNGIVVGRYEICGTPFNEAFVWTPNPGGNGGTFKTLPRPANVISASAHAANSMGFVVGSHTFIEGGARGFIFDPNTQEFKYLLPLDPEAVGITLSTLNSINEGNVAVGSRRISPAGQTPVISHAVIWHPYGKDRDGREVVVDIGDFGVGPNSSAWMIDEQGLQVIGWTGSQFSPTGFHYVVGEDVTLFNKGTGFSGTSNVFAITLDGAVGGSGTLNGNTVSKAFVWKNGSVSAVIDPLPGFLQSGVTAMNDLGQTVVRSTPGDVGGLYQKGKQTPLSDLIVGTDGFTIFVPRAINNQGQMLARAVTNNKTIGVILSPIGKSPTDLNADCVTDVHDLLLLLNSWGPCISDSCPADFTDSGSVGVPDLLYLLSHWG